MDSMAMRLMTDFRRAELGAYDKSSAIVQGQVWENRSCLNVAWGWLVLPAVLLSMCIVSMVWLAIGDLLCRSHVVAWKGSILPFLLNHKVPTLERMGLGELDLASKKFEIKLER